MIRLKNVINVLLLLMVSSAFILESITTQHYQENDYNAELTNALFKTSPDLNSRSKIPSVYPTSPESFAQHLSAWQFRKPVSEKAKPMFETYRSDPDLAKKLSEPLVIKKHQIHDSGCEMILQLINSTLYLHPKSAVDFKTKQPIKKNWIPHFKTLLKYVANLNGQALPDLDFAVSTPDRPYCKKGVGSVAWSYSTSQNDPMSNQTRFLLIPYTSWMPDAFESFDDVPFSEKKPVLYWRGTTTGIRANPDIQLWPNSPKSKWKTLCTRWKLMDKFFHVKDVDIGFSKLYAETPQKFHSELKQYVKNFLPLKDALKEFGYILDVEGNSFSDRIKDLMRGNVAVVKQDYEFIDFLSVGLLPWVHYVPVERDLSDLMSVWESIKQANSKLSLDSWVANRAEWAKRNINYKLAVNYMKYMIDNYAKSIDYVPELDPKSQYLTSIK